jgi:hypothetical protein
MHEMAMHFAAPPRRVPLSLRIVNFFNGLAQIGWVVFGFGFIFFWVFGLQADLSFATFHVDGRANGRVTRIESTGASENKQPVQKHHYEYSVAGRTLTGTSYATGGALAEGEQVTVEYDEGSPERSRIEGMRRAMFGPGAMVVVIFPLVGFVLLYFATRSGIRRNHLLREGILTTGVLVRREPTNMTVNNRRVWEMTFEFTDRSGQRREATARATDTSKLEDDTREPLLYDPDEPSRAYVLDEAPSRPRLEGGELVGRGMSALFALIIPLIVVGGHALIAAIKYDLW